MTLQLDEKEVTINNGIIMINSKDSIIIKKIPMSLNTYSGKVKSGKFFINDYQLNIETGDWEKGEEVIKSLDI